MNQLRISLVIPAYNEERHLRRCLDAVARQTVAPFEVILVDNNSTDNTLSIARKYPFVSVVSEYEQGVVFARAAGFGAATGDIIGRIDVDTVIDRDWVETIQRIFAYSDVAAVSGAVRYYDMPLGRTVTAVDLFFRRYLAKKLDRDVYLYGANMAIRRSAWQLVAADVCTSAGMHEDFDLAIHLNKAQLLVTFDERLWATVSNRRVDSRLRDFYRYVLMSPRTYAIHRVASRRHMYPVVVLVLCFYMPIRAMHRGFDPTTGKFSVGRMLFKQATNRVDPTMHHEALLR